MGSVTSTIKTRLESVCKMCVNKVKPIPVRWRFDCDYQSKLTPEQLKWLDEFLLEYYLAEEHSVHPDSKDIPRPCRYKTRRGTYRQEAFARYNAAGRDIMTKWTRSDIDDEQHEDIEQ